MSKYTFCLVTCSIKKVICLAKAKLLDFIMKTCTNKLKVVFVIQTKLGLLTVGFKKAV